ncbi:MAG: hypothetical protein H7Z72_05320 [Bacteroidetes bacterium]|nr:hypothetical protein [Fibrella sp.]
MKRLMLFFLLSSGVALAQERSAPARQGQPTLVYKTRKDYRKLVPVLLSADKTAIVAYPAPTDIYYRGRLAVPVRLKRGYLLDNRGIGSDVGFLKLTYEEYAKLSAAPPLTDLYDQLIDKDPLTELYDCGNRADYKNVVAELNKTITAGKLTTYRKIK